MAGTRRASVLGEEILGGGDSGLEASRAGAALAVRGSVRGFAASSVGAVEAGMVGAGATCAGVLGAGELGAGVVGGGATGVGAGGFAAGSGRVTETLSSTAGLRRAE